MKRLTTLLLAVMVASSMLFTAPVFAATSVDPTGTVEGLNVTLGPNGVAAKDNFNIADSVAVQKILPLSAQCDIETINSTLKRAKESASSTSPSMVYIKSGPSGGFDLNKTISIPNNVALVCENSVVFNNNSGKEMVRLKGALYGGTFNGKMVKDKIIEMVNDNEKDAASYNNMLVTKATLKNTYETAVLINGAYKHGKVIGNTITNCQLNGVCAYRGGQYDVIQDNKITKIGHPKRPGDKKAAGSAIDLCSSYAKLIKNNTINDVYGHGISTDPNMLNKGCVITEVTGNTISKINSHGIYVENKCSINKLMNNKISNVKGCCLTIDKNAKVHSATGNVFSGGTLAKKGKHSLVTLNGKKSYLKLGKKNAVKGGSAAGIYVGKKAKLLITGSGNLITKNKKI